MIKKENMTSMVGIRFEIEGVHYFEGALNEGFEEVNYLSHPHRHLFKFECVFPVKHDDRDKEFIITKHDLIKTIKDEFWSTREQLCWFDNMSCEMMAKWMLKEYEGEMAMCTVSEDDENYAIAQNWEVTTDSVKNVKIEEISGDIDAVGSKNINIIIVGGYIASGKTFVARQLADKLKCPCICLGDVVRELTQTNSRVHDKDLDESIVDYCNDIMHDMAADGCNTFIFEGPRTLGVLNDLAWMSTNVKCVWVEAPFEERKRRYENRNRDGELKFETAECLDHELGIDDVRAAIINGTYGEFIPLINLNNKKLELDNIKFE